MVWVVPLNCLYRVCESLPFYGLGGWSHSADTGTERCANGVQMACEISFQLACVSDMAVSA